MRKRLWAAVLTLCIASTAVAQDVCPAVIQDALDAIANNCSSLERNSACYGFNQVSAEFSTERPAGYFTKEADQAELTDLTTLQTSPLNEATEEFGAAVMNLQADVPDTIPGQGVIFLLLGDTSITNGVTADQAATPAKAVGVQTAKDATIYRLPSSTATTLTQVTAGQTINVDGTNTNGEWVRVIINEQVGWIALSDLTPSDALAALPDVGATTRTPMQAFYFTTGIGQSGCVKSEPTIAVQSPEGIEVNLSVNGVDIRVGSMVTLRGNSITVHRGHVDTSTGQSIEANQTLTFPGRDENGNFTGQGEITDITDEEFEQGGDIQNTLNDIAEANGWPTRDITPRDETACTDYVVQRGDTLFRIAFRQKASMQEIADQNQLTPPYTLFVGQTLCVPNAGSGFVSIPGAGGGSNGNTGNNGNNGNGGNGGTQPNDTVVVTGSTIVGPSTSGRYQGGAVTVPAGGTVSALFELYGIGYTSQLGGVGAYDCGRSVLYRVEGDARATRQAFTCSQGAITTTSVGSGDYLVIVFDTADQAAAAPSSFSLLTGQ